MVGRHDWSRTGQGGGLLRLSRSARLLGAARYARQRLRRGVLSLTAELTRRCNARCDCCDHWREPPRREDADFADVVRRLDPLLVVFCGGEPLLRRDLEATVRRVAAVPGWRYHALITNGSLLTVERGLALRAAGLQQLDVSLDWPDAGQDEARGIGGLFARLERTIPALTRAGVAVRLSTMIMRDNLEELVPIAHLADRWGAAVGYTLYSTTCNGNPAHSLGPADAPRLARVAEELIALKRAGLRITSSDHYLRRCVDHARGERSRGCPAGRTMIHVSPQGLVKPCADLPALGHYARFDPRAFSGVDCDRCWMACRGEAQAPVDLARVRELVGI